MGRDTRIVGERGQITIPKDLRERFGIRGGDEVVVRAENEQIVIAQRTVDDRLEEGYREWRERDRAVAQSTFDRDVGQHRDGESETAPDDVPAW